MKALLAGTLFVVCLLAAGLLATPATTSAAPALTPTASPTPTALTEGPNLVPTSLDLLPFSGGRPSMQHPVQLVLRVANLGTVAVPAGSVINALIYVNSPPDPGATPAFTMSLTLASDM